MEEWRVNPRSEQLTFLSPNGASVIHDGSLGEFFLPIVAFFSVSKFYFSVKQSHPHCHQIMFADSYGRNHCQPQTYYLSILWAWVLQVSETDAPSVKRKALLCLQTRSTGLREATRERLSPLPPSREHPQKPGSEGQEKMELGNPTEWCLSLKRDKRCFSLSPWGGRMEDLSPWLRQEPPGREGKYFGFLKHASLLFLSGIKMVYSKSTAYRTKT